MEKEEVDAAPPVTLVVPSVGKLNVALNPEGLKTLQQNCILFRLRITILSNIGQYWNVALLP